MKKFYNLIFNLLVAYFLNSFIVSAQCPFPGSNWGTASAPTIIGQTVTVTTCAYAGLERSTINGVTAGNYYVVSYSGPSANYVTIYDASFTPVAFGPNPVAFTAPSSGTYYSAVFTSAPPSCGSDASCYTCQWTLQTPPTPCVAPPTAGVVTASANPVCAGSGFTLSLTGSSTGSGLSYQWQESATGSNFTNIVGATNNTYSTSIFTQNYYRCVVTCSGQSDTTAPLLVTIAPFYNCYCASNATSTADSKIDRVQISNIDYVSNPTTCETVTNINSPVGQLFLGLPYSILVRAGTCGGTYTRSGRVFIDYDHSGTYDIPNEIAFEFGPSAPGSPQQDFTGTVNIPLTASTGNTGMRVVLVETTSPSSVNPCGTYLWGETENYIVNILPQPANEAGISAIVSPQQPACTIGNSIEVTLTNQYGTAPLTSATITYSINGGSPVAFNWSGNIAPNASQNVVIGSASFNDMDVLKVWVSNPNGVPDIVNLNDTIEVTLYNALSGVYTVYGTSPDYNTLNDAVADLETRGICGNVTFNLRSGTYNEQVLINDYASLGNYSVTIQAETQNAADVKLEFFPGLSNNYVIGLEETHDIVLQHLTLANTSFYASVVNFLGGNEKIIVKNCRIYGDSLATIASINKATIVSAGEIDNDINLINNEIVGGSYGIWMFGQDDITVESGLKIENNIVRKYYGAGVVAVYQNRPEIRNNIIYSDNSNTNTNIFHLDVEATLNGAVVTGNNVRGIQGGFGVNLVNVDAQPGNKSIVANNFVYMGATGSPTNSHGITIQDCSNAQVVFNSVHTMAATTTAAGIRIYNGQSSGINLLNNNVVNSGAGYAVNSESQYYIDQSDYNNFFTTGANYVRVGSNAANLAALQSATGKDGNSWSVDPNFNGTDLHTCRVELDNAGIPVAGITVDYDGDTRNTLTPDIGADEFMSNDNFTLGPDIVKCPGDVVTIGAEEILSANYYWSPTFQTTPSITVSQPGTYILQVVHGCGYAFDTVIVTNSALPNASFNYTQNFFTASFNNTSTNATSYHWNFGDGNTSTLANPNHVFPTNGTYTVTLIAYSDCGDSAVATQVVVINPNVAGIEDENVLSFGIYPNPSEGVFAINISPIESTEALLQVMDLSGKLILTRTFGSASFGLTDWIDMSEKAAGTYVLKLTIGQYSKTTRLIIK
ncbi:MAG: PKD domain-containing protein [Flavobacteriales bacterium]|nr:PKD domain-containing protein [Flavobacteriales bacterium]